MTDQCKHCDLRGDITKCSASDCFQHENWFATQQAKQIQELQVQVERLRGFLDQLAPDEDADEVVSMCDWDRIEILKETPAQSLNEIKAGAIEEAILLLLSRVTTVKSKMIIKDAIWALRSYAKQLREG